jgi:hypothetical protein
VRAYWAGRHEAFVRDGDPLRRSLQRVTGWRPATERSAKETPMVHPGAATTAMPEAITTAPRKSAIVWAKKPRARR